MGAVSLCHPCASRARFGQGLLIAAIRCTKMSDFEIALGQSRVLRASLQHPLAPIAQLVSPAPPLGFGPRDEAVSLICRTSAGALLHRR